MEAIPGIQTRDGWDGTVPRREEMDGESLVVPLPVSCSGCPQARPWKLSWVLDSQVIGSEDGAQRLSGGKSLNFGFI